MREKLRELDAATVDSTRGRACRARHSPEFQRLAMYPPAANTKITISMQMAGRAMPGS